jgi:predicted transcriptional regulator
MNEKSLKKLGLTTNMSRIYLAVLQSLSPIRSVDLLKNTKLTKSSFYDALHGLEDRGIVAKIGEGHDSGYVANDPQVFIQEAQTRQVYAEDMAQQITSRYGVSKKSVRIYQGGDAIQQISEQMLAVGEPLYFLGPSKFGVQAQLGRFWAAYHKKREKKGIPCKILYDKSTVESILKNRNTYDMCEAKYLPSGYEGPIWFMVSGSITGIIVPGEEPPLIISITSLATSERMRKYFLSLWKQQ